MSPEEWAFKIKELIEEAEADTGWYFDYDQLHKIFCLRKLGDEGWATVKVLDF